MMPHQTMEDEWENTNPEEEKISSEQQRPTAWTLSSPRTPIFRTRRDAEAAISRNPAARGADYLGTSSGTASGDQTLPPPAHQQHPPYYQQSGAPYWGSSYPPPPYPGQDASGPPPSTYAYPGAPPGHYPYGGSSPPSSSAVAHPERVTPQVGRESGNNNPPPSHLPGPYSPIRQRPSQPQVTPHPPPSGTTTGHPPTRSSTTATPSYPSYQQAYAYPLPPYHGYAPHAGPPPSSYPIASYSPATDQRQQPPPSYTTGVTPPGSHSRANTAAAPSYGESHRYPATTSSSAAQAPEYSPYYPSSAYPAGEPPRVSYDTNSGTPSPAGPRGHEHHPHSGHAAAAATAEPVATASTSRQPPPDYVYLPNTGLPPPPHHPYYHGYSAAMPPHHPSYPPHHHHHYPSYATPSAPSYPPAVAANTSMDDGAEELGELVYNLQENDVLCGRGAPTTYHPGNQYFKELVNKWQPKYIASRRSEKPQIATKIVEIIRGRGGRFLKRTKRPGLGPSGHFCWEDVGEQRAYEKACQALRENAPEIRKRIAAEEGTTESVSADSHSERGEQSSTTARSSATTLTGQDDSVPLLRQASTMEDDRTLSSSVVRKRPSQDEEDDDDDTTLQSRGDGRAEEFSRSKRLKASSSSPPPC